MNRIRIFLQFDKFDMSLKLHCTFPHMILNVLFVISAVAAVVADIPMHQQQTPTYTSFFSAQPAFEDRTEAYEARSENEIPHTLFRTFSTHRITDKFKQHYAASRKADPTLSSYYYDDAEARDIIADACGADVQWAFDELQPGAYKSDIFRLCLLYAYGGVYADISVKLTQRLSSFVPNDTTFFIPRDPNDDFFYDSNALWQGFFGAAPGHPVLKKVMEKIIEHCHMCFYGDDPLAVTGPTLVGKVVAEYLGTSNLTVGTYADPWLENGKMVIFDAKREDDGQITVFNKQGRSIGERDPASVVAEVYFPGFRAEMNLISSGATYVHYTLYWVADNVYRAVGPCGQIALSQKRAESMFNEDGTPSQYYWNRVNTRIGNLKLQRASYREWGQLDVIRAELIQQAAVEREQRRVNKKTKLIVRRVGHGRGRGH